MKNKTKKIDIFSQNTCSLRKKQNLYHKYEYKNKIKHRKSWKLQNEQRKNPIFLFFIKAQSIL